MASTSATRPKTRAVGGTTCKEEYLYMVSLRPAEAPNRHICAGTLINPRWVLTAAHCYMAYSVAVLGNKHNMLSIVDMASDEMKVIDVFYMIRHPEFNDITKVNDIALAYLTEPANKIKPVKLPTFDHQNKFCGVALIIGWGYQHEHIHLLSSVLNCVWIETLDCGGYNAICTQTKGKDACQGDSGGPLMCKDVQYGIVSYGKGCMGLYPGIYTRIDKNLAFIKKYAKTYRSSGNIHDVFLIIQLFLIHIIVNVI